MKKTTITRSVTQTLGVAAVALAAGLFLGCGGGDEDDAEASTEDAKAAEESAVGESDPPPDADGGSGE